MRDFHFSNERMRTRGSEDYFSRICNIFEKNHSKDIKEYGSDNALRLTGDHETQSIEKFSYGVSDRGASIRIPIGVVKNDWKGYLEDRRPAANADPYKVVNVITKNLAITLGFD